MVDIWIFNCLLVLRIHFVKKTSAGCSHIFYYYQRQTTNLKVFDLFHSFYFAWNILSDLDTWPVPSVLEDFAPFSLELFPPFSPEHLIDAREMRNHSSNWIFSRIFYGCDSKRNLLYYSRYWHLISEIRFMCTKYQCSVFRSSSLIRFHVCHF